MRPSTRLRARAAIVGATLVAPIACHSYVPVTGSEAPGREVRIELSDEGAVALAATIGPRARVLDGTLRERRGDSTYVLSLEQVTRAGGVEETWTHEVVDVPRSGIERMLVPKVSVVRTGLFAGGLVALGVVVSQVVSSGGSAGGRLGGGGGGGAK